MCNWEIHITLISHLRPICVNPIRQPNLNKLAHWCSEKIPCWFDVPLYRQTQWVKLISNLSLYMLCYAEAFTELAGPNSSHCAYRQYSFFRRILFCIGSEPLATLYPIWPARDLNLRLPDPETNALPLDQLASDAKSFVHKIHINKQSHGNRCRLFWFPLASWSSGNAFVSGAGGLKFKPLAGQIGLSVANGLPPLQHFFERSCEEQWSGNGPS